jgi:hypothetical protein
VPVPTHVLQAYLGGNSTRHLPGPKGTFLNTGPGHGTLPTHLGRDWLGRSRRSRERRRRGASFPGRPE